MNVLINYSCKWQLVGNIKYVLSECGLVINSEKKIIVKRTEQNGVIGYYLDRKFTQKIVMKWEKIPIKNKCPFGTKKY
jgi:hypothetical protein